MPPTDSLFLLGEAREHPMHVGGLQLFELPEGAGPDYLNGVYRRLVESTDVHDVFLRKPVRALTSLGQWSWRHEDDIDLEYHVRFSALPRPGRVRELLALVSRLHGTLLDRHRPLWEVSVIEGMADGRFAMYFKVHHALVDGVGALRLLQQSLSEDPDARDVLPPWARRPVEQAESSNAGRHLPAVPASALRTALSIAGEAAGLPAALVKTVNRGIHEQAAPLSFSAPKTMLNVPITGARRFAAQSWPIERIRRVGKEADATVNDVVLAMCSGALRGYMRDLDALPETPLIAMVPVSLRVHDEHHREGGNAVGVVMCNLATNRSDPADRLAGIHASMTEGKAAMSTMSPIQIMAMSLIGLSPLALAPLLGVQNVFRPPFNLVISNVPGPRSPLYYNGARLVGMYPLSIPVDGQALNITCTSYSDELAFGLTGCRRSVPHLQRLLGYLGSELEALEQAVGVS